MPRPKKTSKKQTKRKAPKRSAEKVAKPVRKMPMASAARRITGTVSRIVGGRQTSSRLSAEQAFSDPEQAAAQVRWAEANGPRR